MADLTLYTTVPAETRWLHDRWCATAKDLPFYAYGVTAEEATTRLSEVMYALIDSLMIVGGREMLDEFMKRCNIPFQLSEDDAHDSAPFEVAVPVVRRLINREAQGPSLSV